MLASLDCNQLVSELTGTGYSELEPGSLTALTREREPAAPAGACAAHPAPKIEQNRLLYWRRGPFQTGVERSLDAAGLGARATSGTETRHSSGEKCGLAPH